MEEQLEEERRAKIRAKLEEEERANRPPPLQKDDYCRLSLAGVTEKYGHGHGPLAPDGLALVVLVIAEEGADREEDDSKTRMRVLRYDPEDEEDHMFWYQSHELERAPPEEWPAEPEPEPDPEPEPEPLTEEELLDLAEQRIVEARAQVAVTSEELDAAETQLPILTDALAARRQPVIDALAEDACLREERVLHLAPLQKDLREAMEGLKGIHWADFFELKRREFFIPELLKRIFDCVMILRHMDVAKDVAYELDTDFHGVQHLVIEDSYDCVLPLLQTKWSTHGAERCSLVSELLAFHLDGVNDETIELMQPYVRMDDFNVDSAVGEMEGGGLDTSIAEGLCTWSLFVQEYRAAVKEFANEGKLAETSLHRGYMQRLERLAEEAVAAGHARAEAAETAKVAAEQELKDAEHSLLELLGEDEEALRRAAVERKKHNVSRVRHVTRTAEGLAQLRLEAEAKSRRKEERGRLLDVWNAYDVDGSGDLDREEVRTVLKKMGRVVTESKLDHVILAMDENGDGMVEYEEFMTWWEAQDGVEDEELGWPFSSDIDELGGFHFELYERAVQLKNAGEWQAALTLFDEYRQVLMAALVQMQDGGTPTDASAAAGYDGSGAVGAAAAAAAAAGPAAVVLNASASGRGGAVSFAAREVEDQEHGRGREGAYEAGANAETRFDVWDAGSPVLPPKFRWDGVLSLAAGDPTDFGNHRHLRPVTAPAAIRSRGEAGAANRGQLQEEDDVLLRALSTESPEFWQQLAAKRECRQKYGMQGTVGFLNAAAARGEA